MTYIYENEIIPDEIASFVKSEKSLQQYFRSSFSGVKPNGHCGFISLNGKDYLIVPKYRTRNLKI